MNNRFSPVNLNGILAVLHRFMDFFDAMIGDSMEISKLRELEKKLQEMIKLSKKTTEKKSPIPDHIFASHIIRRRIGEKDKRIPKEI